MELDRILDRLERVRHQGSGWSARCPAHEDRRNSLSVTEGEDGRVLLYCHAGCSTEDVVAALGLEMRDLFAAERAGGEKPRDTAATAQPVGGCSLEEYAQAKGLPVEFLLSLGLREFTYASAPSVRVPYVDETGEEIAVRFRISLEGDERFRWRKGSKPRPYGLSRLRQLQEQGYVILVEGESDAQTLWLHERPALGLPGASVWSEERDAPLLARLDTVYVVIEPDAGGEAMLAWISESSIRDKVKLVRLEAKDVSELYLREPERFQELLEQALQSAIPWAEHACVEAELRREAAWNACAEPAEEENILARLGQELEQTGLVGEQRNAKLVYLALTSRLLDKPVSLALKGPSSGGKSHTVARVLELFPDEAYHALTAMSERALAYSNVPLAHRFLILYEAAGLEGEFASYLLRSLLSEGRVRYETVEKTPHGMQARVVERPGPTGLIVTTTAISLHPENETRLLSLTIRDTPEQTKQILLALAQGAKQIDTERWQALQTWLAHGDTGVVIPYAPALADLIPPLAVRLRRDFQQLLSLIGAHALLHQVNRGRDVEGRIIATLVDYAAVRDLVHDLVAESVEASVSPAIRETVTAVAQLANGSLEGVSSAELAQELNLDKGPTSRRVQTAIKRGYLKNLEERRGRPSRLVLDQPLPIELELLPASERLLEAMNGDGCAVASEQDEAAPPTPPLVDEDTT